MIDNARWCGYLQKMTVDEAGKLSDQVNRQPIGAAMADYYVKDGISKQNYGSPIGEKWYQRTKGGILKRVWLKDAKKENTKEGGWK